MNKTIKF